MHFLKISLPLSLFVFSTPTFFAFAQPVSPDRRNTFEADQSAAKQAVKDKMKQLASPGAQASEDLDFQAPYVEFQKEKNIAIGKGGMILSQGGVQVQADEGQINLDTKDGIMKGHVAMTTADGVIFSREATINTETETGRFNDAKFTIESGNYDVESKTLDKLSEYDYELDEPVFSTCHCMDNSKPWEIRSSSCHITQDGYAHNYNAGFYFQDIPLFYSPWMAFPVKDERSTGLLQPTIGYNNKNGVMVDMPFFIVTGDSSDLLIDPFIATNSRYGTGVEYRQAFSLTNSLQTKIIYSDESWRGQDSRGLNYTDILETERKIDMHRFGGYINHSWRPDPELDLPVEFIADGKWVSDNVFLREIPEEKIGDYNASFLTSQAAFRAQLWDSISAELRAEGNQNLLKGSDQTRQRLPDFVLSGSKTFRPFGQNSYGIKFVTSGAAQVTQYVRQVGTDGLRTDLNPGVAMPFRFSNMLRGQLSAQVHQTYYNMDETLDVERGNIVVDQNSSRTLPILSGNLGSSVERVFDLPKESLFSDIISLGADNAGKELVRVKHTIEPFTSYTYIPTVDQSNMPLLDTLYDQVRAKSLVNYGVRTRLLGRYQSPLSRTRPIGELVPMPTDLPVLDVTGALDEFSRVPTLGTRGNIGNRDGSVGEIMSLTLRQGYDYLQDKKNIDPTRRALTDLGLDYSLTPSDYLGFAFNSNFNTETQGFSQYAFGLSLRDDRSDSLKLRYTYVNNNKSSPNPVPGAIPSMSQLEANAELKISEMVRLGYYGRYNDVDNPAINSTRGFLENRGVVRFSSECRCWSIDVGYSERVNPNVNQVLVSFTLLGLGDITQNFGVIQSANQTAATQ